MSIFLISSRGRKNPFSFALVQSSGVCFFYQCTMQPVINLKSSHAICRISGTVPAAPSLELLFLPSGFSISVSVYILQVYSHNFIAKCWSTVTRCTYLFPGQSSWLLSLLISVAQLSFFLSFLSTHSENELFANSSTGSFLCYRDIPIVNFKICASSSKRFAARVNNPPCFHPLYWQRKKNWTPVTGSIHTKKW
jgi:hypothetical protein